jgi:hypothetical protein
MKQGASPRTLHGLLGAIIGVLLVIVWARFGFWPFVGGLLAATIGWILAKYFWE